jgi:hypothetical protein
MADPERDENLLQLAALEGQSGNTADALFLVKSVLQKDPNHPVALRYLNHLALSSGGGRGGGAAGGRPAGR